MTAIAMDLVRIVEHPGFRDISRCTLNQDIDQLHAWAIGMEFIQGKTTWFWGATKEEAIERAIGAIETFGGMP